LNSKVESSKINQVHDTWTREAIPSKIQRKSKELWIWKATTVLFKMIFYTCIARTFDGVVLAEAQYPTTGGNGDQIMRTLMDRLVEIPEAVPPSTGKTFSQCNRGKRGDFFADMLLCNGDYIFMDGGDEIDHFFHVWNYDGIYYSCISDDDDNRAQQVNFDFLKELQTNFKKQCNPHRIAQAKELDFQKKWLPNIRSKSHYYNTNHTELRRRKNVQLMLNKVEDMKTVLNQSILLVLHNQETQLTVMRQQSDDMKRNMKEFRKRVDVLQFSQGRKKELRYWFCFSAFGIIILFFILIGILRSWF